MGEEHKDTKDTALAESGGDRLRRSVSTEAMSVELVSAFAGDRVMTGDERARIDEQIEERGGVFFSDLFYTISHHYFAPDVAESLWGEVTKHKLAMTKALGRNVRITVATLDYLSNITGQIESLTLISETHAAEITALSMRDGMTGLYNHSSCYELLELEFRNHRRYGAGLSLFLVDIDDFKLVNDRHGHQEGDRVIIQLARTMTEQVRDSDICCRLGGEEFVAILPFTSRPEIALEIAERVREKVMTIRCGGEAVTISAGIAVCDQQVRSSRELLENADRALYSAKRRGKNRVVLDEAPPAR
ncbi:MAG: GGDEF domain-containing protein [Deltaproteobacteria bacterium]|nr:GGDEF domain-containing protein [Deltaproteobacteria bacterium]